MHRRVMIFAGPNGSGKSTIIENAIKLGQCPDYLICADNFVPAKKKNDIDTLLNAADLAEIARYRALLFRKSFAFETVMSTHSKLDFIRHAKRHGYHVHVVYVNTGTPDINVERVQIRVNHGGHDVPKEKIISRYKKSLELMFDVICEADSADIYDNSGNSPVPIAAKLQGKFCVRDMAPRWLQKHFISKALVQDFEIIYF